MKVNYRDGQAVVASWDMARGGVSGATVATANRGRLLPVLDWAGRPLNLNLGEAGRVAAALNAADRMKVVS